MGWAAALRLVPLVVTAVSAVEKLIPERPGQTKQDAAVDLVQDLITTLPAPAVVAPQPHAGGAAAASLFGVPGFSWHLLTNPQVLIALRALITALVTFMNAVRDAQPLPAAPLPAAPVSPPPPAPTPARVAAAPGPFPDKGGALSHGHRS